MFRGPDCSFLTPFHPEKIDANGSLDITHEALIRQWSRLRDWAEDKAKWARDYETLADAAARREGAVDYLRKQSWTRLWIGGLAPVPTRPGRPAIAATSSWR